MKRIIGLVTAFCLLVSIASDGSAAQKGSRIRKDGGRANRAKNPTGNALVARRYKWLTSKGTAHANNGLIIKDVLENGSRKQMVTTLHAQTYYSIKDDFATPGSRNIQIQIDEALGETTFMDLKFQSPCVLNILPDGTVVADKPNIPTIDSKGKFWISRAVRLNGKRVIAFVPGNGPSAENAPRKEVDLTGKTLKVPWLNCTFNILAYKEWAQFSGFSAKSPCCLLTNDEGVLFSVRAGDLVKDEDGNLWVSREVRINGQMLYPFLQQDFPPPSAGRGLKPPSAEDVEEARKTLAGENDQ